MITPLQREILTDYARREVPAGFAFDPFEDAGSTLTPIGRREVTLCGWGDRLLDREWLALQLARPRTSDGLCREMLDGLEMPEASPSAFYTRDGLPFGVREPSAVEAILAAGLPLELVRQIGMYETAAHRRYAAPSPSVDPEHMADFVESTRGLHLESLVTVRYEWQDVTNRGFDRQIRRILESPAVNGLEQFLWYSHPELGRGFPTYADPLAMLADAGLGRALRSMALCESDQLGRRFAAFLDESRNRGLVHVRLHSVGDDPGMEEALAHPALSTVRTFACCMQGNPPDYSVPALDFRHLTQLRTLGIYDSLEAFEGEYSGDLDCAALVERLPTGMRDLVVGKFSLLRSPQSLLLDPRCASIRRLCVAPPTSCHELKATGVEGDHRMMTNLARRLKQNAVEAPSRVRILSCGIEDTEDLEAFKYVVRSGFFGDLLALELIPRWRNGADRIAHAVREVHTHVPNLALVRTRIYIGGEEEGGIRESRPLSANTPCLMQRAAAGTADTIFEPLREDIDRHEPLYCP